MRLPAGGSVQVTIQHGRGCATCNNNGYKGGRSLREVMEITMSCATILWGPALELKKRKPLNGMIRWPQRPTKGCAGANHPWKSLARNGPVKGEDGRHHIKRILRK